MVTVYYDMLVLVLYLELGVLIVMIDKIIAESCKGIVLININACMHRPLKHVDLLFDAEIREMLEEGLFTFSD